jgi:hypothetical protein
MTNELMTSALSRMHGCDQNVCLYLCMQTAQVAMLKYAYHEYVVDYHPTPVCDLH